MPLMDPRNRGCPPKFSLNGWDFLSPNLQTNHVILYWMHIHCMTHSLQDRFTLTKLLQFYKIVPGWLPWEYYMCPGILHQGGKSSGGAGQRQWNLWLPSGSPMWLSSAAQSMLIFSNSYEKHTSVVFISNWSHLFKKKP